MWRDHPGPAQPARVSTVRTIREFDEAITVHSFSESHASGFVTCFAQLFPLIWCVMQIISKIKEMSVDSAIELVRLSTDDRLDSVAWLCDAGRHRS